MWIRYPAFPPTVKDDILNFKTLLVYLDLCLCMAEITKTILRNFDKLLPLMLVNNDVLQEVPSTNKNVEIVNLLSYLLQQER